MFDLTSTGSRQTDGDVPMPVAPMPRFFRLLREYGWQIFQLNLTAALLCLPILTIPAVLYARNRVLVRLSRGDAFQLWSEFWGQLRHALVRYLPFFLLSTGISACGGLLLLRGLGGENLPTYVLAGAGLLLCIDGLLVQEYGFAIFAMVDQPLGSSVRNAVLLTLTQHRANLQLLLFPLGLTVLAVLFLPYTLVYFFLFAPCFTGLMSCCILSPVVERLLLSQS